MDNIGACNALELLVETGQFADKPTHSQSCRGLVNSPTMNFLKLLKD